eukprot:CAMPEP_0198271018 /NCGR_PEP_ID=MMETSP1447-20131203/47473_1 /TAXON_ID=420782 /ORGANISM="Chaetoceros dichaeta, Strain CCMP1751" /LENGTH=450 /DNA_ID=CAMNT_0043963389 /DNA_START=12 /DNA_END=1364 /DNA_ORIENTATION=-
MAQNAAIRRLKKEYANLQKEPTPGAHVQPLETNFLHAHFILLGEVFYDTPYEGGVYHGVLKFPSNYPLKPPTVIMRTPSARFQPDQKICFSMSDFHPELWNPMWSIRSILTGLISFMNSEDITTGGVEASSVHRIDLAKKSLKHCMEYDALASELFKDELESIAKEREGLGSAWPPKRNIQEKKDLPKIEEAPVRRRKIKLTTRLSSQKEKDDATSSTNADKNEGPKSSEPPPTSNCSSNGKTAAKNKKKREKEKRKKLIKRFTSDLLEQVPKFLEAVEARLLEKDLNVCQYHTDHVCWRTEALEEYSGLVSALRTSEDWALLVESEIGGRSIATFQMKEGISFGDRMINVIEIPAPKDGSPYKSGLEHVEFVVSSAENEQLSPRNDSTHQKILNEFMAMCPCFEWSTKAKDKEMNPDVSTKIELPIFGTCTVKFHLMPLAEVIKYEINN